MSFTLAVKLIKMNKATTVGSHAAAYIVALQIKKIKFSIKEREESLKNEHL